MGDTVVKTIRDLTLYLGEFTVLPGEAGTRSRLKQVVPKISGSIKMPKSGVKKGEKLLDKPAASHNIQQAKDLEKQELKDISAARDEGDTLAEDIHRYHYLIIQEVRKVMEHLHESPPRKYTYEEWAWFLKLMGEDESSYSSHRKAPIKVLKEANEEPDTQQAQSDDKDEQSRQWSWLGNRSPLMGETEEAEWVLERLSLTLEKELEKMTRPAKANESGYGDSGERRSSGTSEKSGKGNEIRDGDGQVRQLGKTD